MRITTDFAGYPDTAERLPKSDTEGAVVLNAHLMLRRVVHYFAGDISLLVAKAHFLVMRFIHIDSHSRLRNC